MKNYDPTKYGAVVAIRIYLKNGHQPEAELVFAFGGTETIHWDVPSEREKYASGINGYTLFYDERPKREFKDWVKDGPEFTCPLCGETFKFRDKSIKGFEDIEGCTCTCTGCGKELLAKNGKFVDFYSTMDGVYTDYIEGRL